MDPTSFLNAALEAERVAKLDATRHAAIDTLDEREKEFDRQNRHAELLAKYPQQSDWPYPT